MVLLSLPSFPASFGGRLKPHADKNPAVRNRRFVSLKYKRLFFLVVLAIALRLSLIGPNLSHVPRPPSPANHKDLGTWSWGRTIWINTYPCRKGSPQEAPCYTYQESKNHGPRQAKSTDSLKNQCGSWWWQRSKSVCCVHGWVLGWGLACKFLLDCVWLNAIGTLLCS